MDHTVILYGLAEEEVSLLQAALPEGYKAEVAECVTDLIVAHGVCSIVAAEKLDRNAKNTLIAYYLDVGDRLDETVVWLGNVPLPELPAFVRCDCFPELLTDLDSILTQSQAHYGTMQQYSSEYAYLPKHAIEESIEADIHAALHRKYGKNPDPLIVKRLRQELTALREVDALPDLAAVWELTRWLKAKKVPFFVEYITASGLIPYLLGITHANPLPPHTLCPGCGRLHWHRAYKDGFDIPDAACPDCGTRLHRDGHDLVSQEFCSYGRVPTYGFWLPASVRKSINDWLENHWLKHTWEEIWGPAKVDKWRMDAGVFYFIFALEEGEISSDFHQRQVTADQTAALIRLVDAKRTSYEDLGIPYPKTAADALAVYALTEGGGWNPCAQNLLSCGLEVADLICCREDVFHYLCDHGFEERNAFRG